jgi:G3E family GTPase
LTKLPVTVIGGYLGAGKTTLINHLLRTANGVRLAVLVNEFGDLAIDADLIEAEDDGLISISGGCVCCAYGSDMIGALDDIQNAVPRFDHILIEASGVALPGSIMTTVGLTAGLRPDATIVLADADQIRKNAKHKFLSDTILRQLDQADIILVTKIDIVSSSQVEDVCSWLGSVSPNAQVIPISNGNVDLEAVVGTVPFAKRRIATQVHNLTFQTITITPTRKQNANLLASKMANDSGITRAKGYVETDRGVALIHVVGSRFDVEMVGGDHPIGIVCIGIKDLFVAERVHAMFD